MRLALNEVTGPRRVAGLALLALVAAVLAAFGLLLPSARASGDNAARVLTVECAIEFGRGVDIRLEAESDAPVTEVRAVFAAQGERRVSSYAYAAFTQQGARLEAEFTIDTGVRAYYPPGTEFEVYFELTGADGSIVATEPFRFLYLDPLRDWQLLSRPDIPVDIYYYGFAPSAAEAVADRIASSWRGIAAAVGVEPDDVTRHRAVIYPNVRDFTPAFPPTSAAASDGLFFGGFAMHRYGVFALGGPSPASAAHELTHLLVDSAVTSPLSPGVPSWLHEGLAQYFEAGSSEFYSRQLATAVRSGDLLTLRNRNTLPARSDEIGLFYTQVGSFVGDLIERYGPEQMAETLRLINGGETAAEAVEEAYGRPLWELENEWRVSLGADPLPVPAGTPATGQPPTPQASPTPVGSEVEGASIGVDTPQARGRGFNWGGPIVGAGAAIIVFIVWSVTTNRKRFRKKRR